MMMAQVAISCSVKEEIVATENKFMLSDTMLATMSFSDVQVETVKNELKLFGKINAANNRQAQVYPVVGGSVVKVNAELGDYVKQGQVLAVLRSSEVAEFERQKMDAQNDISLAEKNLQVARDLFAGKLTSEKDVLAAEKELEKSKAANQRIKEVFNIYNLGKGSIYNVTAPISGFIIDKNVNQNMQIRSDRTDFLFSIAQIDEVWVMANVNESDIGKIQQGMDAEVHTISYPDKVFTGKVDRIYNILDPDTKAMKARISISNKDLALKPEMNATVTIRFTENKNMIAVPSSAVIFDKSKNWVMVYTDRSHIETRLVEVYRQLGDKTYIASGLQPGEKVITTNQMLVYDALND